jgi:hypothetical protein
MAKEEGYEGIARLLFLPMEKEGQSDTKLKFLEKSLFSERGENRAGGNS